MNLTVNVLEIFPGFALWYQFCDLEGLAKLRAIKERTLRGGYLHGESNTSWQCYHLKGRATAFNLKPNTFHFIGRSSEFGIIESRVLDIKCRGWLKQDGIYGLFPLNVDGFEGAITIDGAEIDFRPGMFILKQGIGKRAFAFALESTRLEDLQT